MSFSQAPWFTTGANHAGQLIRDATANLIAAHEGVARAGDCKVSELGTPGTSVQIADGGVVIQGRFASYQGNYADRCVGGETLPVPSTSSSPRSDLVCVRVEDPEYEGILNPAVDNIIYPYLITNVPAGSQSLADAGQTGLTAVVLARLDIPANTTIITDAMITDVRRMAVERARSTKALISHSGASQTLTSATLVAWPSDCVFSTYRVPEWANRCDVKVTVVSPNVSGGAVVGALAAVLASVPATQTPFNIAGNGDVSTVATFDCTSVQDTIATFGLQALKASGAGTLLADTNTSVIYEVTFYEVPV